MDDEAITVHRLVQEAFLDHQRAHLQDAFDAATILMYESFPKQVKGNRFDEKLPSCARLFQHALSLLGFFVKHLPVNNATQGPSLKPKKEFIQLLCNVAWYCVERQDIKYLQQIIDVALGPAISKDFRQDEPYIYAHLCNSAGRLHCLKGDFKQGEKYLKECLEVRKTILSEKDSELGVGYANLGNLFISVGKLDQAVRYEKKALEIWSSCEPPEPKNMNIAIINQVRALYAMGKIDKADELVQQHVTIRMNNYYEIR